MQERRGGIRTLPGHVSMGRDGLTRWQEVKEVAVAQKSQQSSNKTTRCSRGASAPPL